MSNLRTQPVGKLVEPVVNWNPLKADPDDEFDYIDLSAVDQEFKTIIAARKVTCGDAPSRARQIVSTDDVLVSTVRPNLNGVARVPAELDQATASTGFCVLRPKPNSLSSSYLFHWVKSPQFVADMIRKATGASYPAVSDKIIFESLIPIPSSFSEQIHIAAILDQADALRVKRREALAQLDSLTQAIFIEMFGDPVTNPKGWRTEQLAELIVDGDTINYGVVQPGDDVDDGIPLVRVGDLVNGHVCLATLKKISPSIESAYKRSRLYGDEILISCVGSVGVVALANTSVKGFNIARAVARVRLSDKANRDFIAAHLRTDSVQRYFTKELRTVSQPTLNIKQLSETVVMCPPIEMQLEFATRCSKVGEMKLVYDNSRIEFDNLFASLQHRAFRGQL